MNDEELQNLREKYSGWSRMGNESVHADIGAQVAAIIDEALARGTRLGSADSALSVQEERINHLSRERDEARAEESRTHVALTEVVRAADESGWNGVTNPKSLPRFIEGLAKERDEARAALAKTEQERDDARESQALAEGLLKQACATARALAFEEACDAYDGWAESFDTSKDYKAHLRALASLPATLQAVSVETMAKVREDLDLARDMLTRPKNPPSHAEAAVACLTRALAALESEASR